MEIPKEVGSKVVEEPRPLYGEHIPRWVLQRERPEHRIIIMLASTGMGAAEISEHLRFVGHDVHKVTVANLLKQPWAMEQVLLEIERAGREPVRQMLQGESLDAAQRLVELAKEAKSEETKRKANNDILDRVFGKPNQPITHEVKDPSELSDEELAKIAQQSRRN